MVLSDFIQKILARVDLYVFPQTDNKNEYEMNRLCGKLKEIPTALWRTKKITGRSDFLKRRSDVGTWRWPARVSAH